MYSWQSKEISTKSPGHALNKAMDSAVQTSKGYARTDIFVQNIKKTTKGWQAELAVIAEGRLNKSRKRSLGTQAPLLSEKEKEEEDKKKKEKRRKEALDRLYRTQISHSTKIKQASENENIETLTLYSEFLYEDLIHTEIAPRYNFTAIHFLTEGSLWEEAQKRHPDLELFEAAHETAPFIEPDPPEEKDYDDDYKEEQTLSEDIESFLEKLTED